MRFQQLFESESDELLYRGDSSHVEQYDTEKTDSWALFGVGIYLTDSKLVAADYTAKGREVVFPTYKDADIKYRTPKSLIMGYIKKIVMDEMHFVDEAKNIKYQFEDKHDIWSIKDQGQLAEIKKEIMMAINAAFAQRLDKAKQVWDDRKKDFAIFKDTTGEVRLVSKATNGVVSMFQIPQEYLAKTFDGEAPLSNDCLAVFKDALSNFIENQQKEKGIHDPDDNVDTRQFDLRDLDNKYMKFDDFIKNFKKNGTRHAWTDDNRINGGKGKNPSFDELFNGTHNSIWKNKEQQMFMAKRFLELGYTGIRYKGGERVGSHIRGGGGVKHTAYVIWDSQYITDHRVNYEVATADDIKNKTASIKPEDYGNLFSF